MTDLSAKERKQIARRHRKSRHVIVNVTLKEWLRAIKKIRNEKGLTCDIQAMAALREAREDFLDNLSPQYSPCEYGRYEY